MTSSGIVAAELSSLRREVELALERIVQLQRLVDIDREILSHPGRPAGGRAAPARRRIVGLLAQHGPMTRRAIAEMLGVTGRTVTRHLGDLLEEGEIVASGRTSTRIYSLPAPAAAAEPPAERPAVAPVATPAPRPRRASAKPAGPAHVALPASVPGADGRPLTSHLLDVVALAGGPVRIADLVAAVALDTTTVERALAVLHRRGRITRLTEGRVAWIRPDGNATHHDYAIS